MSVGSVTTEKTNHFNIRILTIFADLAMEQRIFNFFIDYRGQHRKGIAIYNATEGS
jgi:hypothetical protein